MSTCLTFLNVLLALSVTSHLVIPQDARYIMCISNKFFLCSKRWRTSYFCLCHFDLQFSLKVPSRKFCSFRHRPKDHVWMMILSLLQKTRKLWFNILLFLSVFAVTLKVQSCKLCNNNIFYDRFNTNNKHWDFCIHR